MKHGCKMLARKLQRKKTHGTAIYVRIILKWTSETCGVRV
jgi:hypothetical protein